MDPARLSLVRAKACSPKAEGAQALGSNRNSGFPIACSGISLIVHVGQGWNRSHSCDDEFPCDADGQACTMRGSRSMPVSLFAPHEFGVRVRPRKARSVVIEGKDLSLRMGSFLRGLRLTAT
jgi:hypothetical protein